jgi:hypothetical protein
MRAHILPNIDSTVHPSYSQCVHKPLHKIELAPKTYEEYITSFKALVPSPSSNLVREVSSYVR